MFKSCFSKSLTCTSKMMSSRLVANFDMICNQEKWNDLYCLEDTCKTMTSKFFILSDAGVLLIEKYKKLVTSPPTKPIWVTMK